MQSYQRSQHIDHTDFNTSGTNASHLLPLTKVGTRSAFGEGSHTRAHTPKQGAFRVGRYHYPRHELHVHEHPRAGCQNGKLCRFWVLVGGTPEGHREPAEQRCAYARRCSAGVAAPLGCATFLLLSKLRLVHPALSAFRVCETWEVSLPSACSSCC